MKNTMHLRAVEAMLREKIGFGPYPNGTLARCISRRMRANGIEDEAAYASLLFSNGSEQEELIEEIVVPETWFFRDYEPFVHLRKFVADRLLSCSPENPLRVLSVPSSTGEEAYSIAITLLEAGFAPDRFRIDAVDISRRALRKAAEARYGPASFREKDLGPRLKYFEEAGSMFRVRPEVSQTVCFRRGNVLEDASLGPKEFYDVVFFRNLLIYFDEDSRKLAIENVERVLKKGGLLVRGYAEPQKVFFPRHVPVDHVRSHSCRKPSLESGEQRESAPVPAPPRPVAGLGAEKKRPARKVKAKMAAAVPPASRPYPEKRGGMGISPKAPEDAGELGTPPVEDIPVMIARARELADAGNHSAAEELAGRCLKTDAACLDAHYLLATTALARGDEENARTHLNRVVYLDPAHEDALLHLSLLMDRNGQKDQAARYRKRILRSRTSSTSTP